MGTRASFFINDPQDLEERVWLGCIAFDGYPDGISELGHVRSEDDFRRVVEGLRSTRSDFADPKKGGFPFPWSDDLFLTDFTYAWMGGRLQYACFHHGFVDLGEETPEEDTLPGNVPAPSGYDASQPDSIMVFGVRP